MSDWTFPNLDSIGVAVHGREFSGGTFAFVLRAELYGALDHRGLLSRFRAAYRVLDPGEKVTDLPAGDVEFTVKQMLH